MEKIKKPKKEKPPKAPKIVLSEEELAMKQAAKMLRDMGRLQNTQSQSTDQKSVREGSDIWKDSDFFFSVVFQSAAQKYTFLEIFSQRFSLGIDQAKSNDDIIQVVNGIALAEKMGITLQLEKSAEYPYPNLDLKPLAIDSEEF